MLKPDRVMWWIVFSWAAVIVCTKNAHGLYQPSQRGGIFEIFADSLDADKIHVDYPTNLSVPAMAAMYGYDLQTHRYTTSDGYTNVLHRLPPAKSPNGQVVFLQHGFLGTSADWVMSSPKMSFGYVLADKGFDVWMGNARGNVYSEPEKTDGSYWDFSFHEMGKYDIPAAIDYVRSASKVDKIFYVGHSMGTMMFWIAALENPDLADKIHVMVALGPVANVTNIVSPIRRLAPSVWPIREMMKFLGIYRFTPSNALTQFLAEYACDETMLELELCEDAFFLMTGFDAPQMNLTLLPIILGHEPGGTSMKTVYHFAQNINAKRFRAYDYWNRRSNIAHYGTATPPDYDVSKVNVPVVLMWADNDWLADPKDVAVLASKLPKLYWNYRVPMEKFNHVDFLWGLSASHLVWDKVLRVFSKFM